MPSFTMFTRSARVFAALVFAAALSGCGYNSFQSLDEKTKAAWSEVLNQYQRRADLIPNIVSTVKGEAAFPRRSRNSRPRRANWVAR